ncbi:hypothetical protein NQF78_20545 [Pseudomonas monsensis]|uniref:Prophage PssSM-01 n=1 Tax=Pseudomonas monsensis TaxID=2745509 RepID=A0ABT3YYV8_9PSED|nr:hypothetical protein [Pseudomonas monsensis]MCY0110699.1 hypothetical protein [Pseudomonas monsensis]
MNNLSAVPEYQDVLQSAALAFLERHHCEHLSDDQQLFSRAVQHLVADYDVQTQVAEKIVHLAGTTMVAVRDRQRLNVRSSTSTHTVIVDPVTGRQWAVPVSLIYERIINAPDLGRFRLANS